jgi:hypothetical protein
MPESFEARKEAGAALLHDHLERLGGAMSRFIAALTGFCMDVQKINPDAAVKVSFDRASRAFITPAVLESDMLSALSQTLTRATTVLDGSISVPKKIAAEKLTPTVQELDVFHSNLSNVEKMANQLHSTLTKATLQLYRFNAENREEFQSANISFNEDSLAIATTTARAIAEHAVRLDIDVVAQRDLVREHLRSAHHH